MPCLLNDKLSPWAARSVEPLRRLVKRRNFFDHAAEVERQVAALAGLQRQAVTRFGKTA